ncbi:MAG TPA: NAD(P)/FAD-dependent oxidoreductase [Terriglobia bacterium]|nr:NAD(P)/FAD-dependent oxidoreductase [Terriglobia bacterium]
MSHTHDAIIIGAGHNGLVTAFYLARAGLKPLLVERRAVAGGVAATDEFAPGFKCSTLAHSTGPLAPDIVRDLQLERYGLETIQPEASVFAPTLDGRALVLYQDTARSAQQIAAFSQKDAGQYAEFERVLGRLAAVIEELLSETPPSIDQPSAADLWHLVKVGRRFRSLGKKDMLRLLRWGPMPVADLAAEWFESGILRALVATRGIFGTFLGPRSPGTSAVLLLRAAADPHPVGAAPFVKGGMGALSQALVKAASEAGAELRTSAEVSHIAVRDGRAAGVVLSTGEEVGARMVISNVDPRRTFLGLLDPVYLDPDFILKMRNYRCHGTVAKVNLALAGLPAFTALKSADQSTGSVLAALAGRILIAPEIDYLERAFDDAKYGSFSRQPWLEIAIPSLTDPTLAPAGQHVVSIYVQYAPFKLKTGDWEAQREALGDAVIRTLAEYAPDLPGLILHRQVITPRDLEDTYGLTGGHIFHGELALDQLFTMRPLLGWARYRTPLGGLYLCGSGTHPGTGLTGVSGRNAAREILSDGKKWGRG